MPVTERLAVFSIGVVAGLAQGAKLGGPLLIPITILSIFLGARKDAFDTVRLARTVAQQRNGP
jgi:hypothetical protein